MPEPTGETAARRPRPRAPFRRVVAAALASRVNLALGGAGAVAAAAIGSWSLAALALAGYLALVAWDCASAEFRRDALRGAEGEERRGG